MYRLHRWTVVFVLAMLGTSFLVAPAAARPDLIPGSPVYVALGDSWAWGQGADDPATEGYVPQLAAALREDLDCLPARSPNAADGCKHLQLVNLGRPAMDGLPGVDAQAVLTEQLPVALPLLESRNQDQNPRNDVEVVTLHVGGNDVFGPIAGACLAGPSELCTFTIFMEMAILEAELDIVVGELRDAAGSETPIVLGTYDNSLPHCYLGEIPGAVELGIVVLEGTPDGALDGIHDVVRRVAADYDADVAEVFGSFTAQDFVGGLDCRHPTSTGHDRTTEAFLGALGF